MWSRGVRMKEKLNKLKNESLNDQSIFQTPQKNYTEHTKNTNIHSYITCSFLKRTHSINGDR